MTSFSSGDTLNAVVADVGQYATKIGFAGEDYPRSYFRSNVAVLREEAANTEGEGSKRNKPSTTADSSDNPRNTKLQPRRRINDIRYDYYSRPILANGQPDKPDAWNDGAWECTNPVDATTGLWCDPNAYASSNTTGGADWNDLLQRMIQHGFSSALGTEPKRHPLLLVERSYNPPPLRQQVLECMFEDLNVPAVFLARDATMACYACGRTTGTVVDIGHGGTTVTPVYEGYVEQKGIRRSPYGTLHMDGLIVKVLDQLAATIKSSQQFMPLYQVRRPSHAVRAEPFHRLARLHVAQQCREEGAGAAVDTTATAAAFATPLVPFHLPDGQMVNVPSEKRFAIANLVLGANNELENSTINLNKEREEIFETTKKNLSSYIATASLEDEEQEGDDTKDATERVYTEATAVGISSRRTRKSKGGAAAAKAQEEARQQQLLQQQRQQRRAFSNRLLQKACAPYLQVHLDQQLTSSPLANMVCDAAFRCDRDQQASLLGNVILGGGGACLGPTDQSVPDQLRAQVESIIHTHTPGWRVKVLSPSIQERSICSWLGGSILASLGTFHDMWITRAEYDEWGPAIVNRKCP